MIQRDNNCPLCRAPVSTVNNFPHLHCNYIFKQGLLTLKHHVKHPSVKIGPSLARQYTRVREGKLTRVRTKDKSATPFAEKAFGFEM